MSRDRCYAPALFFFVWDMLMRHLLCFSLSYRDIEEIMAERGIMLTYETVRKWCLKFGQRYAKELRHRRSHPGDKWHLDEVFVTIKGQLHYVWRAVDQHSTILGVLVQSRRDKKAAQKFLRKLLKELQYVPHRQTGQLCRR